MIDINLILVKIKGALVDISEHFVLFLSFLKSFSYHRALFVTNAATCVLML